MFVSAEQPFLYRGGNMMLVLMMLLGHVFGVRNGFLGPAVAKSVGTCITDIYSD